VNQSKTVRLAVFISWMLVDAALCASGRAQAPDKMDFTLRKLLDGSTAQPEVTMRSLGYREVAGVPYVTFFAQFTEKPADYFEMDVQILGRAGHCVLASAPVDRIRDLSLLPEVVRLEGAAPAAVSLDLSVPDIRADEVWTDPNLGWDQGEGVVVGMVDTGINLEHQAFLDDAVRNRIRYVWDMTDSGGPPPAEDVCGYWDETGAWVSEPCGGSECGPQEIAAGTCRERDVEAAGTMPHGTAVMGTQAANWFHCNQEDPDPTCRGVAPLADIVAVKLPLVFNSLDVAQGASYVFAKAEALDVPAVVNLSVGSFRGPRDGSSVYEQFMTGLVDPEVNPYGPRRILVASAANEGLANGHAEVRLTQAMPTGTAYAQLAGRLGGERKAYLEGWYSYDGSQAVRVRLLRKFFQRPEVLIDWLAFGETETAEKPAFDPLVRATLSNTEFCGAARGFVLELWSEEQPTWEYQIEISADGLGAEQMTVVDLWIDPTSTSMWNGQMDFTFKSQSVSPAKTLATPCTADDVICVSSYNSRCPSGYCGEPLGGNLAPDDVGSFSAFSSRGPRRDGVLKPEVGAPGQAIIVPAAPGETTYLMYAVGTSFSSPHVAGTVALLLRNRPDLLPQEIVEVLEETVRPWDIPEEEWLQETTGYRGPGKLDAYAIVDLLSTLPIPPTGLTATAVNGSYAQLAWQASPSEDVVSYAIYYDGATGEMDYAHPIGSVPASTLAWRTPRPLPAGRYLFGVRAVNAGGEEDRNRSVAGLYLMPQLFGGTGDDDFCFIASAAFRDAGAPRVVRLRAFRDRFLLPHAWGRALVRVYYRVSPPLAERLRDERAVAAMVRTALLPAVGLAEVMVHRPLTAWIMGVLWAGGLLGCLLGARIAAVRAIRRIGPRP